MNSPINSFKGYKFSEWFNRNKDNLKMLLMGVSALATYFSTQNIPAWLQIILTMIVPTLVKIGVDAIDFYKTKVVN